MVRARAGALSIAMSLAGACDADGTRPNREDDASHVEDTGHAVEEDAAPSSQEGDAGPPDAATDASERDGEATAAMDGASSQLADAAAQDARVESDAAAPCAVEAGADSSCVAHLCELDGSTALALEQDEAWLVGALGWVATICGRSLGWPAAVTSDARQNVYSLSSEGVGQLRAGAPVQTYYGGPSGESGRPPLACTLELREPTPACRATR